MGGRAREGWVQSRERNLIRERVGQLNKVRKNNLLKTTV